MTDLTSQTIGTDGTDGAEGAGALLSEHRVPSTEGPLSLEVSFTGSGSEYARIWVANLLLTCVTLGLYHPWARARRLDWFASNTWVGNRALGSFSLDFHCDPRRMLVSYLAMLALLLAYLASDLDWRTAWIGYFAMIGLMPVFMRGQTRFRINNMAWRGLPGHFSGTLAGAARALLPLMLAWLIVGLLWVVLDDWISAQFPDAEQREAGQRPLLRGEIIAIAVTAAIALFLELARRWADWRTVCYRHRHLQWGGQVSRFDLKAWAFFRLPLIGLLWTALAATIPASLMLVLHLKPEMPREIGRVIMVSMLVAGVLLVYFSQTSVRGWVTARRQNLVWSATSTPLARFSSVLDPVRYVRACMIWAPLTLVSCGLLLPFATVALYRLRLEAVTVISDQDLARCGADGSQAAGTTADAGAQVFDAAFDF